MYLLHPDATYRLIRLEHEHRLKRVERARVHRPAGRRSAAVLLGAIG